MSTAKLKRDKQHRYYIDGKILPGVTTVLGTINKPALIPWAQRVTAETAVQNYETLGRMIDRLGPESATKWLKGQATARKERSGELGTRIHKVVENLSLGKDVQPPKGEELYWRGARNFLEYEQPEFLLREQFVCNLTHGYGGTGDAWARINGETYMLDYKTSGGVYNETALQLAAYGNAEFGGSPDGEHVELPKIDKYAVVHIRPELENGYNIIPVNVDGAFEAFLAALKLYHWLKTKPLEGYHV